MVDIAARNGTTPLIVPADYSTRDPNVLTLSKGDADGIILVLTPTALSGAGCGVTMALTDADTGLPLFGPDAGNWPLDDSTVQSARVFTRTLGGSAIVEGDNIRKTGIDGWDSGFKSVESYTTSAWVSFQTVSTNKDLCVGLCDPAIIAGDYANIDYGIFLFANGTANSMLNGAGVSGMTSQDPSVVYLITYDGVNVRFYANGQIFGAPVARAVGNPLYLGAALFGQNAAIKNVKFGTMAVADNSPAANAGVPVSVVFNGSYGAFDHTLFSHITIPDSDKYTIGTGSFYIGAWIKHSWNGGFQQIVISKAGTTFEWAFTVEGSEQLTFTTWTSGGGSLGTATSAATIPRDVWVHVEVIIQAGGNIQLYINGVADGAPATPSGFTTNTAQPVAIGYRTDNAAYFYSAIKGVVIRQGGVIATAVAPVILRLDNLPAKVRRIAVTCKGSGTRTTLTYGVTAQWQNLTEAPGEYWDGTKDASSEAPLGVPDVLVDGPVSLYRLNEASGTVATDAGPISDHGTYISAPTLAVPGHAGGLGVLFDGVAQYVSCPSKDEHRLGAGSAPLHGTPLTAVAFSAELWLKIVAYGAGEADPFCHYDGNDYQWMFGYDAAGLMTVTTFDGQNGATSYSTTAVGTLALNTWYHLALTTTLNTVCVYKNGRLVATGPVSLVWPYLHCQFGYPTTIGARSGSGPNRFANCVVEGAAIYQKVLTPDQILAHANS